MAAGKYLRTYQSHTKLPPIGRNWRCGGAEAVRFNAAGSANPFPVVLRTIVLVMYNCY